MLTTCILLLTIPVMAAPQTSTGIIRVGIAHQASSVDLCARGNVHATEISSGEKFAFIPDSDYSAETDENRRVIIGNLSLSSPVKLIPVTKNDRMEVNGRTYRGNLLVTANPDETLTIVEELGIEEYLCGVLPIEMSPGWPLEALKAQAVVSRTFALKNMGKFKDLGFDISADMFSQVYGGSGHYDPRVLEAVRSTTGEVLTYKGKLIPAYFHSCCGGRTTAPASVWGAEILRPLAGISDPYCRNSPHYAWKTYIAARDILKALQRNGSTALRIRGIRITKRDRSGRTLKMKFVTDQGSIVVSAKDFRSWMGEKEIKSTYILRISPSKGGYIFAGRGWGHGVGLCQYGARVMAERKKKYRSILQHYYPGARVRGTLLKD